MNFCPFINHSKNLDQRGLASPVDFLYSRGQEEGTRNDVPKQARESCRKLLSGSRVPVSRCREMGEIQPRNGFGNLLLGRTGDSPWERLKVRIRPEKLSTGQS